MGQALPACLPAPHRRRDVILTGSAVDVKNLTSLFEHIGLKVQLFNDLSRSDVLSHILAFSQDPAHKEGNMMILVVLSHGEDDGKLVTCDNKHVEIEIDIIRLGFTFQSCSQYYLYHP